MLNAILHGMDGRSIVVVGLSRENTTRLHNGLPIPVDLHALDPRLPATTVIVMAGETEHELAIVLCETLGEPDM